MIRSAPKTVHNSSIDAKQLLTIFSIDKYYCSFVMWTFVWPWMNKNHTVHPQALPIKIQNVNSWAIVTSSKHEPLAVIASYWPMIRIQGSHPISSKVYRQENNITYTKSRLPRVQIAVYQWRMVYFWNRGISLIKTTNIGSIDQVSISRAPT